jgi:transposase-like protein
MGRSASAILRAQWRKRLGRFTRSQTTVAEFCRREEVSQAAFYQWRRRLAETATAGEATIKPSSTPTFIPVQVAASANLQVVFPNGTRITLPAHDRELVKLSIAAIAVAQTTTGEA